MVTAPDHLEQARFHRIPPQENLLPREPRDHVAPCCQGEVAVSIRVILRASGVVGYRVALDHPSRPHQQVDTPDPRDHDL